MGIDSVRDYLKTVEKEKSYKEICKMNEQEKLEYINLLSELKKTHNKECDQKEKGEALEKIATFVLKSAPIFDVYNNVRTITNELDQLVRIPESQRFLVTDKVIDERLIHFIGECKNYAGKVSVTYVGKVCSLLLTTCNKICILFSYHGVTGENWNDANGLIKKIYLSKENEKERYCIIDFNISDFEKIQNGDNFLNIIRNKMEALQYDTNYISLISSHEASSQINEIQMK